MFYYVPGQNYSQPPNTRGQWGHPMYGVSQRADAICDNYEWGRWFQTVCEVVVEINLPPNTTKKDLNINIKTNNICCKLKNNRTPLLQGQLHRNVYINECTWTCDTERRVLRLHLTKIFTTAHENTWDGLFKTECLLDAETAQVVRNRIDLERFHLELRH